MERQGLISRFFSRVSDADRQENVSEGPLPQSHDAWDDNATRPVHALVQSVLQEPRCLIVTGYKDFLSSLTIVLDTVHDLAERPWCNDGNRVAFNRSSRRRPLKLSMKAFWIGLPGAM